MRRGVYALLGLFAQRCVSMPWSMSEPTFGLKKDIYQNIPPWESKLFDSKPAKGASGLTASALQKAQEDVKLRSKISKYTSPALYVLLKQVDEKNEMLAMDREEEIFFNGASELRQEKHQSNSKFATENENPLPKRLASLALIRAYVCSLAAAFCNSNIKRRAAAINIVPPKGYRLMIRYLIVSCFISSLKCFHNVFIHKRIDKFIFAVKRFMIL